MEMYTGQGVVRWVAHLLHVAPTGTAWLGNRESTSKTAAKWRLTARSSAENMGHSLNSSPQVALIGCLGMLTTWRLGSKSDHPRQ